MRIPESVKTLFCLFAAAVGTVALYVLFAAIAPMVHAGTCPDPPLFDMTGPVCTAQRQTVECGCSECMEWDPSLADPAAGIPAAEWYEIGRQDPGSSQLEVVGTTWWRNHAAYDWDGELVPATIATSWCFVWDTPVPQEGKLYLYRVRACMAGPPCGTWSSRSVDYVMAPYWIGGTP